MLGQFKFRKLARISSIFQSFRIELGVDFALTEDGASTGPIGIQLLLLVIAIRYSRISELHYSAKFYSQIKTVTFCTLVFRFD